MVINIGRRPNDRRLINSLYATIQTVFPSLYVSDLSESFNSILFATKNPTSLENFLDNYLQLYSNTSTPALLLEVMATTYEGLNPDVQEGVIFTDDLAPVERITNSMVMNFLFAGELETLK